MVVFVDNVIKTHLRQMLAFFRAQIHCRFRINSHDKVVDCIAMWFSLSSLSWNCLTWKEARTRARKSSDIVIYGKRHTWPSYVVIMSIFSADCTQPIRYAKIRTLHWVVLIPDTKLRYDCTHCISIFASSVRTARTLNWFLSKTVHGHSIRMHKSNEYFKH